MIRETHPLPLQFLLDAYMMRKEKNMGKKIELTGQKFGLLTVINDSKKRTSNGYVIWECRCDCGNTKLVDGYSLRKGVTKSCGCLQKNDITGKRFGKLVAISPTEKRTSNRNIIWKCQCDCGNIVFKSNNHLLQGDTQSCGCIYSLGEQKIIKILEELNIQCETQKTFKDCRGINKHSVYRFDFYLPEYNCCIEYNGKQHYFITNGWNDKENFQKTVKRDCDKRKYCIQNNINYIVIPYYDYNKIDKNYITQLFIGDK